MKSVNGKWFETNGCFLILKKLWRYSRIALCYMYMRHVLCYSLISILSTLSRTLCKIKLEDRNVSLLPQN